MCIYIYIYTYRLFYLSIYLSIYIYTYYVYIYIYIYTPQPPVRARGHRPRPPPSDPSALETRLGDIAKGGLAKVQKQSICSRTLELLRSPLLLGPLTNAPNPRGDSRAAGQEGTTTIIVMASVIHIMMYMIIIIISSSSSSSRSSSSSSSSSSFIFISIIIITVNNIDNDINNSIISGDFERALGRDSLLAFLSRRHALLHLDLTPTSFPSGSLPSIDFALSQPEVRGLAECCQLSKVVLLKTNEKET